MYTGDVGLGVRSHILLTVIGVVVVGFGLLYLVIQPLVGNSIRAEHQERARAMAEAVARDVGEASRNSEDITRRVARWSDALDQVCIGILAPSGVLELTSRVGLRSCLDDDELDRLLAEPDQARWLGGELLGDRLTLSAALTSEAFGAETGRLLYVTRVKGLGGRIAAMRTLILMFMGLAVVLVSLIGYGALTTLIVRPMSLIGRAVGRLHGGDMDARAPSSGSLELKELADTFNRLARKLRDDETRIQHQISELKLINEQLERAGHKLIRSEKLASVGQLAAGVAHEIGNPISIVLGYLEMLERDDCTEEERKLYAAQCSTAIHRVSGIIRDLLDFSRPDQDAAEICEVRSVIEQCRSLLAPQKRFKHVLLETSLPEEGAWAAIGERRLQQVLVNLLMNAADAMLAATEQGATGDSPRVHVVVEPVQTELRIHIRDNGPGIPSSARVQIFDPFFTTKEPGGGTGLGLSICYSIVNAAGGDITIDSQMGRGTTFTLHLPLATGPARSPADPVAVQPAS